MNEDEVIAEIQQWVAENMKWRKEQLGLKLWEISAATRGMDMGAISRILNGRRELTLEHFVRFAMVFGVDVSDWLLPPGAFREKYAKNTKRPFELEVVLP